MSARYEIAHLLFVADNRNALDVEAEFNAAQARRLHPYYVMADALIAAGYEKPE